MIIAQDLYFGYFLGAAGPWAWRHSSLSLEHMEGSEALWLIEHGQLDSPQEEWGNRGRRTCLMKLWALKPGAGALVELSTVSFKSLLIFPPLCLQFVYNPCIGRVNERTSSIEATEKREHTNPGKGIIESKSLWLKMVQAFYTTLA